MYIVIYILNFEPWCGGPSCGFTNTESPTIQWNVWRINLLDLVTGNIHWSPYVYPHSNSVGSQVMPAICGVFAQALHFLPPFQAYVYAKNVRDYLFHHCYMCTHTMVTREPNFSIKIDYTHHHRCFLLGKLNYHQYTLPHQSSHIHP